ncbi:MAG: hypothetical protein WA005_06655 [Candidatus Binataceae bacterium]
MASTTQAAFLGGGCRSVSSVRRDPRELNIVVIVIALRRRSVVYRGNDRSVVLLHGVDKRFQLKLPPRQKKQ